MKLSNYVTILSNPIYRAKHAKTMIYKIYHSFLWLEKK